MKRITIALLIVLSIMLTACGGGDQPLDQRIIGKWSGALTNVNGDKVPATWEFFEGGAMVVEIPVVNVTYGGEWTTDGNRINFTTELSDNQNYRDVEWLDDDNIRMIKEENDITETWSRVEE